MVLKTSLSTIFQLYRGDQFYWWGKPIYQGKPQVTDQFESSTPRMRGIRARNVRGDRH